MPIHSRLVNAWRNVRDAEKYIWCNRSNCPVCLTFSTVWGFKHVTLQCHFNQPRPFSHYRAKEAFDFDGHRFIKTFTTQGHTNSLKSSIVISPNGIFLQLLPINKFHQTKYFEIWFWLPVYTTACICTQYDWFLIFYNVFLIVTFFYYNKP